MSLETTIERAAIMGVAREIDPAFDTELTGPGRFERCEDRALAAAIELLIGGGCEDDSGYDGNGLLWTRIGCWLAARTEDGFWVNCGFEGAEDAAQKLDELQQVQPAQAKGAHR